MRISATIGAIPATRRRCEEPRHEQGAQLAPRRPALRMLVDSGGEPDRLEIHAVTAELKSRPHVASQHLIRLGPLGVVMQLPRS